MAYPFFVCIDIYAHGSILFLLAIHFLGIVSVKRHLKTG